MMALPSPTTLLATKFLPPRLNRSRLVTRERLIRHLESNDAARLVLVSAPAGFGKTSLVFEWTAERGLPCAWLALDNQDNDLNMFWRYATGSLQRSNILPESVVGDLLSTLQAPPIIEILQQLVNILVGAELPAKQKALLILDDYHVINNPEIHESLNYFIEYLPPVLSVVIITRSDPPLNLPRLRAHGDMLEVRAADLRFTQEEAERLLNQVLKLELQPEQMQVLATRTEGWVAGLQLAAISLKEAPDRRRFFQEFAGDDRYVADYLLEEVLQQRSDTMQQFLLSTSILERFCSALCDAVTGWQDGQQMLQALEAENLFLVPLDNRREWYRYHRLFADLLQERLLEQFDVGQIDQLYTRAGDWFASHGYPNEAIELAQKSGQISRVLDLLIRYGAAFFENSQLMLLNKIIDSLPQTVLADQPKILMMSAWSLLATGRWDEVEARLQAIEQYLGAKADLLFASENEFSANLDQATLSGLIEVGAIRTNLAINTFNLDQIFHWGTLVLPYLTDEGQAFIYNPPHHLRSPVLFMLGLAYKFSGQTNRAAEYFQAAIEQAKAVFNGHILALATGHLVEVRILQGQLAAAWQLAASGSGRDAQVSPYAGNLDVHLGQLAYEYDNLEQAQQLFLKGIEQVRVWRHHDGMIGGYTGLAAIHMANGDPDQAYRTIEELESILFETGGEHLRPAVSSYKTMLDLKRGHLQAVAQWVSSTQINLVNPVPYLLEQDYLLYTRWLIAREHWEEALEKLALLKISVEQGGRTSRLIQILLLIAQANEGGRRPAEAEAALLQALTIAQPENFVRTFLDEGLPVARLMRRVQDHSEAGTKAHQLLAKFVHQGTSEQASLSGEKPDQGGLIEPLSDRELEVLHLLEQGLTNKEIARQLMIATTTVKSHTRSIYGKLGVNNRTQAISKARGLGILPG